MGDDGHFLAGKERGQLRGRSGGRFIDGGLALRRGGQIAHLHLRAGQHIAHRRKAAAARVGEVDPIGIDIGNVHLRALGKAADAAGPLARRSVDGDHVAKDGGVLADRREAGKGVLRRLLRGRGGSRAVQFAQKHVAAQTVAGHARPVAIGGKHVDRGAGAHALVLAGSTHLLIEMRAVQLHARGRARGVHRLHVRRAGVAGTAGRRVGELRDAAAVARNGDDLAGMRKEKRNERRRT